MYSDCTSLCIQWTALKPCHSTYCTDAKVVATYHLLKALNPDMQVLSELMLPYSMAYLLPAPTPLLGDPHSSQAKPADTCLDEWVRGSANHSCSTCMLHLITRPDEGPRLGLSMRTE